MNTRVRRKLFLIDHDESQIIGAKLPSNVQVLRVLFYNLHKVKLNLRLSAFLVVKELEVMWNKARIPIKGVDKCVLKVEALYNKWKTLQKTCKRRSLLQEKREKEFTDKFEDLFDIAHADALNKINIDEDKLFLINQRKKGRPGSMVGGDCVLFEKEKRKNLRQEKEERRRERYEASLQEDYHDLESEATESEDEIIKHDELEIMEEPEDEPGPSNPKKKRGQINFITPKLVSVLDKCKISDRDAVRILIATAQALEHEVNDLVINKTSIREIRTQLRVETGQRIRDTFKEKQINGVTIHWDGKMLPSLMGKERVDRLPVVISFNGNEQLLGIPAISSGSGKQQAIAIYGLLKEWDLVEKVEALCCDTTASNLGRLQGACVVLEQTIGKDLLYLPCRHHILEIILRSVFDEKMEKSSGPGVQIFSRFREAWNKINKTNFKTGIEDRNVKDTVSNTSDIIEFASQNLLVKQPRDDYKELLQLAIIFLGGTVPEFCFRIPGAFHHARWMSKAIYCLKIFLFRDEFVLTKCEVNGIRDICIFVVRVYLKVWIQAPNAAEAPMQDLTLLKDLYAYNGVDEHISRASLRKLCNHLWYLTPETAAFSFFDPKVTFESKKRMVAALDFPSDSDEKKFTVFPHTITHYLDKNMEYFISQKSRNFFQRFGIPTDFLIKDPEEWNNDPSFNVGLNIISKLNVVNDSAERAVKLMKDFNPVLSKNEEEKQLILQIVADYRKIYPNANKSTLLH